MYIGKSPQTGAYSILDSLTASATASYTMQLNSVNYIPESAQHLLVSLNGSIQKPNSSFTCSGSTLTFSQALTSADSIDFIYALGNVLDIGTPSDSTVTNAKTNFVSTSSAAGLQIKGDNTTAGTLQLNCEQNSHGIKLKSPPHSASASYTLTFPNDDGDADQVLKTNGSGVLDWTTVASGGLVHLGTSTVSSNVSDIAVDYFSSSYKIHKIYGFLSTTTSGQDYHIQWRNNGSRDASAVYTTTIGTNLQGNGSSSHTNDYGAWNSGSMQFVFGTHNNNTTPARFEMTIYNAMGTTYNSGIHFISSYYRSTDNTVAVSTGAMNFNDGGSNTFEGLKFYPSAGSWDSGEIRVYGVVDS